MIPREINPTETYHWVTKRRNIALIVLIYFLILSITSFLLCYRHYRETTEHTLLNDRQSASVHALLIEVYLHDIVSTMEAYTNRPLLMQAVSQKNWEQAKQHLLNLTQLNPNIDSVIITDVKGTAWVAQPYRPDVLGINFAHRDWYRGVSRQWKPYISEAILRVTGEKDTAIHVAVPIYDKQDAVVGVLLNAQRAVEMGKTLRQAPLEQGLFISITDHKGVIIYSSRYAYERALVRYPFHKAVKDGMAKGVQTVAVSDPSADGAIRYISSATVKDIGWKIFVGRDRSSVLAASSGYFLQIILICFLLFLGITFFLLYARKRVMIQTEIEKLRNENELLASETRFRELFDNMNSGVAIYEAVNNGEDFVIAEMNTAAQNITGVSGGFTGKSVRDVFPGVEEFGLFKIFQQVWYTGVSVLHPTAQYQDQNITLWAENQVYKLPSGHIVAIFNDVTSRRQAEEEVKRLNKNLEQRVAERTAELSAKTAELERINRVFVDRELRMRELKNRIAELEKLSS